MGFEICVALAQRPTALWRRAVAHEAGCVMRRPALVRDAHNETPHDSGAQPGTQEAAWRASAEVEVGPAVQVPMQHEPLQSSQQRRGLRGSGAHLDNDLTGFAETPVPLESSESDSRSSCSCFGALGAASRTSGSKRPICSMMRRSLR